MRKHILSLGFWCRILTFLLLMPMPASGWSANWMQRLSDDAFVASLSIPGSHDSATGEGFGAGGVLGELYARTQDITIGQQWAVGIRAFDLRPAAYEDHLHLHHGIIATQVRFDDVLYQLCDSLTANPSEFVVVHLLHESDGDQADTYNTQLVQLLDSERLKPFLVDFRKDLTVGDMRGKILILSRNQYASKPFGGFFQNWTGSDDWTRMIAASIVGPGSGNTCGLCVQDYSDTHASDGISRKVAALQRLLSYSFSHRNTRKSSIQSWYFNFASAYSLVTSLLGYDISLSDGYRDNASHTHQAILDFMAGRKTFGPTGIVLMDYVGVDQSGKYATLGLEVVNAIIENNFKYLSDVTPVRSMMYSSDVQNADHQALYTIDGRRVRHPHRGEVVVQQQRKTLFR